MKRRINIPKVAPEAFRAMQGLEAYLRNSGLDRSLYELIKIRASQINGCAFCLHMHTRDARQAGETEKRLYLLDAWRETDLYTERERAALALTESITLLAETRVPDEVYDAAAALFSEQEMAALIMAIVAINGWNRIQVSSRTPPTSD